MSMNELEHQLKLAYQRLYESRKPDEVIWVEATPAIPFVGDCYGNDGRCKVLVYGSAENLNFERTGELSYTRNREEFNGSNSDLFFPRVHMTPISDGTLLTAASYLLQALAKKGFAEDPKDFLQQIAVGNYGKFSLRRDSNVDYAKDPASLKISEDYVQADLAILKPDVVVMPRTIHMHGLKPILHNLSQRPEVWRIHQTNSGVINRTIKKQLPTDHERFIKERPEWLKSWLAHIPKAVDMEAYLNWLDWKIATGDGCTKNRWPVVFK